MSVEIIFESHATSLDNEAERASGWNDVDLSEKGMREAAELGERYAHDLPDAVYCSDLVRSFRTAAIAFNGTSVPIHVDSRLRECDYGDLTQANKDIVEEARIKHIKVPFPKGEKFKGESYDQATERIVACLQDIRHHYNNRRVMIIGHRATQYGIAYGSDNVALAVQMRQKWKWQPGWHYKFNG